jgi:hypothetical protein
MVPAGHGLFGSHGINGWMHDGDGASRQYPHPQSPVAGLQVAPGTPKQPAGHCPLTSKHPAAPHSQHTGCWMQSHFCGATTTHCDPGGVPAGHGPEQWVGDAGSKWQVRVVVVVDVVLVDVVVVVWGG